MNKFFSTTFASLAVLALSVTAPAFAASPTDSPSSRSDSDPANRPVIGLQYEGPIKVVYQCTRDEWKEGVSKPLLYLKKLRGYYEKQGIDPDQLDLRAVFHGVARRCRVRASDRFATPRLRVHSILNARHGRKMKGNR